MRLSPFEWRMLTTYSDVASENGSIRPWSAKTLAHELDIETQAIHAIRAAWGACYAKDEKKRERDSKRRR